MGWVTIFKSGVTLCQVKNALVEMSVDGIGPSYKGYNVKRAYGFPSAGMIKAALDVTRWREVLRWAELDSARGAMFDDYKKTIFEFIVRFKRENDGLSPLLREICDGCYISNITLVSRYVRGMEIDGLLTRTANGIVVHGGKWSFDGDSK